MNPFAIGSGAVNSLGDMATSVGTGSVENIAILSGVIATIVVVIFARGLIFRGLGKLGF